MSGMNSMSEKKTILHLPPQEAQMWCLDAIIGIEGLLLKAMNLRDKHPGTVSMGESSLMNDLMMFMVSINKMLRGERRTPFEDDQLDQDGARSWLAEKQRRLKAKIKREVQYRASVPYPDVATTATEVEIALEQEILLLLAELLKLYPPMKLPRMKKSEIKSFPREPGEQIMRGC